MKINYWEKFQANGYYHIYNRGNNKVNVFYSNENKHFFLQKWKLLIHPYLTTLAYCLMNNHFHFLVKVNPMNEEKEELIKTEGTSKAKKYLEGSIGHNEFLEDQFKRLFSSYALAFNKKYNRTGSLFQKRFKRVKVRSQSRLLDLQAYIHHNPIHHRYCEHYGNWPFNSYNAYLSNQEDFISPKEVLTLFDQKNHQQAKASFVKFHEDFKTKYALQELKR